MAGASNPYVSYTKWVLLVFVATVVITISLALFIAGVSKLNATVPEARVLENTEPVGRVYFRES